MLVERQEIRVKTVTVYTKICLSCLYPDELGHFSNWAQRQKYKVVIKRTVYRPDWHKKAVQLWGDDEYTAFVVLPNGKRKNFMTFFDKTKKKPVVAGKIKEVKNDMPRLREAEGANRVDSVAMEKKEADKENKE